MARKPTQRLTPEQKAKRKKRTLVLAGFGLVALVLLIALAVYSKLHGGPALPPAIERRVAQEQEGAQPSKALSIPANTPSLPQQLAQLEAAGRSGDSRTQTLYVGDAELNDILAGSLRTDPNIKSVRAYFGSGKAYVVAVGDWRGSQLNVTVTAEPVIVNGGVQFGVESVKIGSMSAPEAIASKIRQQATKNSGKLSPERTGLYVERIDIRDGVAILTGRAVPKSR